MPRKNRRQRRGRPVGQLARYLRRHCGLTRVESLAAAIAHNRACGNSARLRACRALALELPS